MGKKKKGRGRRAGSAISPIDKRGIKLATAAIDTAVIMGAADVIDEVKAGNYSLAGKKFFDSILNPEYVPGKLFWSGVAMKVAGKYVPELKYMGPVGFR